MAASRFNAKSPTIKRILKEAAEFSNAPSPDYIATPLESDLFEWHFTLRGPPNSPFAEGIYHGRIVLPPTYPLRPPSFRFTTPSGRFEANREICLSISGHHEETWQPAWGVRTALVALRSFMETDAGGQIGGLNTDEAVRRRLAKESQAWTCATCGKSNQTVLREVGELCKQMQEEDGGEAQRTEIEVPQELKLGFKDEMEKARTDAAGVSNGVAEDDDDDDDAEAAQLAEGFVRTAPLESDTQTQPHTRQQQQPNPPPPRPAQGVPVPTSTRTIPHSNSTADGRRHRVATQPYPQQQQQVRPPADAWLDYAIMVAMGLLIAMVCKIMLGY